MQLFSNAVDTARAELLKLRANRERLDGKSIVLEQELAELRAVTGDQLLDELLAEDENSYRQAGTRMATVESQLADIARAHATLIVRIQSAMIGLGKARADELRAKGKKLQAKLDRLSADRLKILESLREIEGGGDGWIREYFMRRGFVPIGTDASLGPVIAPAFAKLEDEIRQLHADAAAIERQAEQNAAGGRISGETLDQLIAACGDVEQLAPGYRAIRAWLEKAALDAERAWFQSPLGAPIGGEPQPFDPDTLFTVVWSEGILDVAASNWQHRQTRRPTSKDWERGARPKAYAQASAAVTRGVGVS